MDKYDTINVILFQNPLGEQFRFPWAETRQTKNGIGSVCETKWKSTEFFQLESEIARIQAAMEQHGLDISNYMRVSACVAELLYRDLAIVIAGSDFQPMSPIFTCNGPNRKHATYYLSNFTVCKYNSKLNHGAVYHKIVKWNPHLMSFFGETVELATVSRTLSGETCIMLQEEITSGSGLHGMMPLVNAAIRKAEDRVMAAVYYHVPGKASQVF